MRDRVTALLLALVCVGLTACGPAVPSTLPSSGLNTPAAQSPAVPSDTPTPSSVDDAPPVGPLPSPPAVLPGAASCPTPRSASDSGPGLGIFFLHVPVLMYHRVIPPALAGNSLPSLVVPPAVFEAQMAALASAGWRSITAGQLAAALASQTPVPRRTFVVTFDDGYDDGYTYALPILRAHRFVATFFVVPGRVGHPGDLSLAHLQALGRAGMEIGNHSMNHVDLSRLSQSELRYQVVAAGAQIQQATGTWPTTFAYPFGAYDPAVEQVLAGCGIGLAFTTREGAFESWSSRLASPRIRVGPGTAPAELMSTLRPYS